VSALFSLLAAVSFGVGDFFGGMATRRGSGNPVPVIAVGHVAGLALALLLVAVFPGDVWSVDLAIGAGAGVVGAVGLAFLFRGLGSGRMGTAAPIAAVLAAVIPAGFGLLSGERPSLLAAIGVALGLIAIPLVASSPPEGDATEAERSDQLPPGLIDGVIAGIGFGLFFILFDLAGDGSGAVPLLGARLATAPLFVAVALTAASGPKMSRPARNYALWSGVLDMAANAWFLAAIRIGDITEVAVLTALAPAGTVALARVVENERLTRLQLVGVPLAIFGVILIATGG